MLTKDKRLKNPISKNSNSFSFRFFNIRKFENSKPTSRFGFVVSKKVDKRAVVRNRAKRVLRSCVEERVSVIEPGFDFLFVLKPDIVHATREELEKDLDSFFTKGS